MKRNIILFVVLFFIAMSLSGGQMTISDDVKKSLKESLLAAYPDDFNRFRIERGIDQIASFWKPEDGTADDFIDFGKKYFIADPDRLQTHIRKLESYSEILNGHFSKMQLDLKQTLDLEWGEILPIDFIFGQFNPGAHLSDDLFKNKVALLLLLNFPHYSLKEKNTRGSKWTREEWVRARMGDLISSRVPADINQKISDIMTAASAYISDYNIYMGTLIDDRNQTWFAADKKLISHWGLRDELKAWYGQSLKEALPRQRLIYQVMQRIITQEIPQQAINRADIRWNPFRNQIFQNDREVRPQAEPDQRYAHWLAVANAIKQRDPYYPHLPSHILRMFEAVREIPEAQVESMFIQVLASPLLKPTARLIQNRLGRKLEPFDIWFNGFKPRGSRSETELDQIVAQKYPHAQAFQDDLKTILMKLGFSQAQAEFIAPKIQVDPARGSGHSAGADMKSDKVRLRTRVTANGMNYKGYNIAVHELGHAVEQTLTLQKVDSYFLRGVPNSAFTEAFAFVFQYRDLELLGIRNKEKNLQQLKALDSLWNTYEIAGVSLVEMKTWNWLYQHPQATPPELKQAVIGIAKEVWNRYFAGIFGIKDQPILAIYSHLIDYALYLPDYALGYLIEYQIARYLEGKNLGEEMERMCRAGALTPELWMKNAVGAEISSQPLLNAAEKALKVIKK